MNVGSIDFVFAEEEPDCIRGRLEYIESPRSTESVSQLTAIADYFDSATASSDTPGCVSAPGTSEKTMMSPLDTIKSIEKS